MLETAFSGGLERMLVMSVRAWSVVAIAAIGFSSGLWWQLHRVRRMRLASPEGAGPTNTPPGWGADKLTDYLELARRQQFATFVNFRPYYDRILEVDAAFMRVHENLVDPEDLTAPFFTLLAHAAYRAAAGLAMSTQSAPAFAAMRQCLENALYCLYINQSEGLQKTRSTGEDVLPCST